MIHFEENTKALIRQNKKKSLFRLSLFFLSPLPSPVAISITPTSSVSSSAKFYIHFFLQNYYASVTTHHYILMCCYAYIYLHITQNDSVFSEACVPRVTIHLGHGSLSVGSELLYFLLMVAGLFTVWRHQGWFKLLSSHGQWVVSVLFPGSRKATEKKLVCIVFGICSGLPVGYILEVTSLVQRTCAHLR